MIRSGPPGLRSSMGFAFALLAAAGAPAAVLHVGPGQTIQAAIAAANPGDEVHVAPGVYLEAIDFQGKAIRVLATAGASATTLDASGSGTTAVRFGSGETPASILEGFRITGGAGLLVGGTRYGGGVAVLGGSAPIVRACVITGNTAGRGGGVWSDGVGLRVETCAIGGNGATRGGGFAGVGALTDCLVSGNLAQDGGGLHLEGVAGGLVLSGCVVDGNTASQRGGGLFAANTVVGGTVAVHAVRCRVTGNVAATGGGLALLAGQALAVSGFELTGNSASVEGGGAFLYTAGDFLVAAIASVESCLVAGNSAPVAGGLQFSMFGFPPYGRLEACTIVGDAVSASGHLQARNSILWNGAANQAGVFEASYSSMQVGPAGPGNLFNVDPRFVNPTGGDYHVDPLLSPCVDAGDPSAAYVRPDIDGEPREQGPRVDMGADEASFDCNGNLVPDYQDIASGTSLDCEGDGVPDECQPFVDCNGNLVRDACDIASGTSLDCEGDGVPDECQAFQDCDGDLVHDPCEIRSGAEQDCNGNGVPDACDLAGGVSQDIDGNGVPDECHGILIVPTQYPTIQQAIDAAIHFGESILLEDGVYSGPGNTDLDFRAKDLRVFSRNGPDRCVLDGGGAATLALVNAGEDVDLVGLTIRDFKAQNGGALRIQVGARVRLFDCRASGNRATSNGGFAYVEAGGALEVSGSVLLDHNANGAGGGLFVTGATAVVRRSTFLQNDAQGGLLGSTGGGAIVATNGAAVTVENSILRGGAAPVGAELRVANAATLSIAHCDVEGGAAAVSVAGGTLQWGAGNFDLDPLMVDAAAGDVHLTHASPCRDAGAGTVDEDFEGDPGVGPADVGADEFHPHLYHTGVSAPGGAISLKVVGAPGAAPLLLLIGAATQPPLPTPYGPLRIAAPFFVLDLVGVPGSGVLVLPAAIPAATPVGTTAYAQALSGPPDLAFTNVDTIVVE